VKRMGNPRWWPRNGRLMAKILITTSQVNLCYLLHISNKEDIERNKIRSSCMDCLEYSGLYENFTFRTVLFVNYRTMITFCSYNTYEKWLHYCLSMCVISVPAGTPLISR